MSLTTARGPLGVHPLGRFSAPLPAGVVYVEPHPRRVQGVVDGSAVIDTERALLVHRAGHTLTYAFPPEAVGDLPHEPEPEAAGYVAVPWGAVDAWFEEGRRLVDYPPNPYHRVDCRPTTRRLRVDVAGTTLVDTDDTVILFETAIDARLYVRPELVRTDLLRRSELTTYCNYKGVAGYWHADVDGTLVENVAWSYDDPLDESSAIAGLLSFDAERVHLVAELPTADWPSTTTAPR